MKSVFRYLVVIGIVTLLSGVPAPTAAESLPPEDLAQANQDSLPPLPVGVDIHPRDALALALAYNPRLAAFGFEMQARDALALQASLRPNPELALEVENFAGSGDFSSFGSAEITLALAQRFELGSKRSKRHDLALIESELATWDYESVVLEVLNEVTRAFIAVVAAQHQVALTGDLIETAGQDLAAVHRRVAAGAASPIELTRARVALATAEMDRETRLLVLTAARAQLAATWGSDRPLFGIALGDLDHIVSPPGLEELNQRLEANPDIARWQTEMAQRNASLAVAQSVGKIDLVAAGGIRHLEQTGDNAFVVGLAVPLPVSNRNQGSVQAAEFRLSQVEQESLAVLIAASAALATSHAELAAAFKMADTLQNRILPEAQEAMVTAESAYLKGLFSFTDVLAVRMTYFELRGRYIASLARYHSAVADIERLVAGPLAQDEQEQERP